MSIVGAGGNNVLIATHVDTAPPAAPRSAAGRLDAVPPQAYFVGSAVFHYLGPSFAVLLFARVDVLGVAWLRIASAAVIFAILRRPWHKFLALDHGGKTLIVALGAVFALMNACFYLSIDETSERRLRVAYEVNVITPYLLTKAVVPTMRERKEGWSQPAARLRC